MKVVGTSPLGPGARWRPETVPGGGGTTMGILGTPWLCRPGPRIKFLRQRAPDTIAGPQHRLAGRSLSESCGDLVPLVQGPAGVRKQYQGVAEQPWGFWGPHGCAGQEPE
ncbi:MAG: hypothetical protein ACOZCE_06290 [Spirochaetota bacterium]